MKIAAALAVLISVGIAYFLTPIVRSLARRLGILAQPGGRRVHVTPTPLMGGLAIYLGFITAVVVVVTLNARLSFNSEVLGILIGATLVAIVGILDDKYELPGWVQALTIVLAGSVLVAFGVKIQYISSPVKLVFGWFSIPVTILWVLMVTKAVDCMDGLDGLAAGIAAIAAGTLMLLAFESGIKYETSAVMAAALMGASLGFLRFNYPPAKLFMGTIGAQFLGFALAGISVAGAFKVAALVAVAAPVLVLSVPLLDTTFVVLRRIATGRRIHEADKTHLHHRLVDKGLSHRQVVWAIYALTLVSCGVAYALMRLLK
jgi:UDP-GlcNAc:undecaprenyl-phosphate GlcNAc-1-phosphate transferase